MGNRVEEEGCKLCQKVLQLKENLLDFTSVAFQIFEFQYNYNPVYQRFVNLLPKKISQIQTLEEIPFLPISFFKIFEIKAGNWNPEAIFTSSGTTGILPSQHNIQSLSFYHQLAISLFEKQFGPLSQFKIIALLPNYQENPNSSLISMVRAFGLHSGEEAVFLGLGFHSLQAELHKSQNRKVLIISVSYALMQLAEKNPMDLSPYLVLETGGMKGFRKEMPKQEIIDIIHKKLNINKLYSEYGMTELQSQAYAKPLEFENPISLRAFVRQMEDPFDVRQKGRGLANIIDLGNVFTCSFIATDDLIEISENGNFQILGRALGAELRGCNLLFA